MGRRETGVGKLEGPEAGDRATSCNSTKGRGSGCEGAASAGSCGWHSSQGHSLLSLLRVWFSGTIRNAMLYFAEAASCKIPFFIWSNLQILLLPMLIDLGHKKKWVNSWKRVGAAGAGADQEEEEEKSLKQLQVTGTSLLTEKPQLIRKDDCENKVLFANLSLLCYYLKKATMPLVTNKDLLVSADSIHGN